MRTLMVPLLLCFVLIFSSTAHGQTNPGVNNAELNGNYAFRC